MLAAAAYPAAAFFDEPRLAAILFALGIGVGMGGFENIGVLDFRRDFAFNREFQLLVVPRILGIVAGITFALIFVNYWALVVGIMTTRSMRLVFTFVMHPYRPRFGLRAWRYIFGFSFWTWIISLGELLRDRSDSLVIGRILNTVEVGIYSVGAEIAALPTTERGAALPSLLFELLRGGARRRECFRDLSAGDLDDSHSDPSGRNWDFARRGSARSAGIRSAVAGRHSPGPDPRRRRDHDAVRLHQHDPFQRAGSSRGQPPDHDRLDDPTVRTADRAGITVRPRRRRDRSSPVDRLRTDPLCPRDPEKLSFADADLLRHTWRSLTATSVMAFVLVIAGLGWEPTEGTRLELAGQLFGASALGAAIYTVVLLGLWAGGPAAWRGNRSARDAKARLACCPRCVRRRKRCAPQRDPRSAAALRVARSSSARRGW